MANLLAQQSLSELASTVLSDSEPPTPIRCNCPMCCSSNLSDFDNPSADSTVGFQAGVSEVDPSIIIGDLLVGYQWDETVLTYSFYSDALGGPYYGNENVSEVTEAIKANVRHIIENLIEPYINVDFVEVEDTAQSHGQIRYMFSDGPGYAYAYLPSRHPLGGDVHLTTRYDFPGFNSELTTNAFQGAPGTYGFETLIHEMLHALGLDHPFDIIPREHDNNTNTVMTYTQIGSSAATMMPYDILALQHLYGVGTQNAGDTVYAFDTVHSFTDGSRNWGNADQAMKLSIWDSGGIDTLDFSALEVDASGYRFDLREGGMLTAQSAYNTASRGGYTTSAYGTAIAFNTTIENLTGSSSDDRVIGNGAANTILGNDGNDTLYGNDGDDYLDGGLGSDRLSGGRGNDTYVVDSAGDVIVEDAAGIDLVIAGSDFQLTADLENLELSGNSNLNGTGNELDNSLRGNAGDNVLVGLAGDDTLNGRQGDDYLQGGQGSDRYRGGQGKDVFALSEGQGYDVVLDFDSQDQLALPDNIHFSDLTFQLQDDGLLISYGNDHLALLMGIRQDFSNTL